MRALTPLLLGAAVVLPEAPLSAGDCSYAVPAVPTIYGGNCYGGTYYRHGRRCLRPRRVVEVQVVTPAPVVSAVPIVSVAPACPEPYAQSVTPHCYTETPHYYRPDCAYSVSIQAAVQRELARQGYYEGAIDGVIGPFSQAAIAAYQTDRGLLVTGRIDSVLLRALGID